MKREVKHSDDDIFNTYVNVLVFMMENKDKSFQKKEIGGYIFGDGYQSTEKNMVSRCVNTLINCEILKVVTEVTDENGNTKELPTNQTKVRLYNKDIDDKDDEEFGIDFKIPKTDEGKTKLSETLSSIVRGNPYPSIYSPIIQTVMESNMFGLQRGFVSQTIGRVILKHHNIQNISNETEGYPLDVIMSIIDSQINVNIKLENFGNTIQLNKTKIKKVTVKENGFDIHFDNFISQNQSDINQIISIENTSEDGLRNDINEVKKLIEDLPSDEKEKFENIISSVSNVIDLFEF